MGWGREQKTRSGEFKSRKRGGILITNRAGPHPTFPIRPPLRHDDPTLVRNVVWGLMSYLAGNSFRQL